jgi:hypothetical protein
MSNIVNMEAINELENNKNDCNNKKFVSRTVEICKVKYKCFLLICSLISLFIVNLFQLLNDNDNMRQLLTSVITRYNISNNKK